MKIMIKHLIVICSLFVLTSCSSTGGVSGESAPGTQGAYDTTGAAPTGGADTYTYGPGGRLGGQVIGGPNANMAERVVYFDYDSAEVRPESRTVIEANARYLLEHPESVAVLEGNTDERGTREYNIGLGERRSDAVRRLMAALGVNPQQMRTVSYGEERPAVAGNDEASYAQNRRVEIAY